MLLWQLFLGKKNRTYELSFLVNHVEEPITQALIMVNIVSISEILPTEDLTIKIIFSHFNSCWLLYSAYSSLSELENHLNRTRGNVLYLKHFTATVNFASFFPSLGTNMSFCTTAGVLTCGSQWTQSGSGWRWTTRRGLCPSSTWLWNNTYTPSTVTSKLMSSRVSAWTTQELSLSTTAWRLPSTRSSDTSNPIQSPD